MAEPKKAGVNWGEFMKLITPVVGDLASGGDRGAFMSGFQRAQQRGEQRKAQQAAEQQRRQASGANYLMEISKHAEGIADPIDFENFASMADTAYTQSGYGDAGTVRSGIKYNAAKYDAKKAEAQLAEVADQLEQLAKAGHDLDQLAESGGQIQLKSGQKIPIAVAMETTRQRPLDAAGAPIARPKKADAITAPSSDYGRSLARYAKGLGKPVEALSFEEEKEFKKQFNQADDKPGDPELAGMNKTLKELQIEAARDRATKGPGGHSDAQAFSMEERLAKSWTSATQSSREMTRQYGLMQTGLKRFRQGDKNGGSQAVLVTFQKILDPTSVVRESEYARTATGQSLMNRMEGYADRLAEGGAGMTDGELAAMVQTASEFVSNMKTYTDGQRRRIENQAKSRKLDPANIFDDVLTGEPPPAPPVATSGPKIGERRTIDGQLGEWDGKGWKAVR